MLFFFFLVDPFLKIFLHFWTFREKIIDTCFFFFFYCVRWSQLMFSISGCDNWNQFSRFSAFNIRLFKFFFVQVSFLVDFKSYLKKLNVLMSFWKKFFFSKNFQGGTLGTFFDQKFFCLWKFWKNSVKYFKVCPFHILNPFGRIYGISIFKKAFKKKCLWILKKNFDFERW